MNDFMKTLKVKVVPLEIPPAPLAAPAPDIDLQEVIAMHAEAMAADKDATTAASHDFPFGFAGTDGNTRARLLFLFAKIIESSLKGRHRFGPLDTKEK